MGFSNFFAAARQILRRDENISPKKLLERRHYLYVSLLALKLRHFRQNNGESYDDAYESAVKDLEETKLETYTNVDLRRTVQELMRPQLAPLFRTFAAVDEQLGIGQDDDSSTRIDDLAKDILLSEYEDTKQKLAESHQAKQRIIDFWNIKRLALETVLSHKGWNDACTPLESHPDAFGMDVREKDNHTMDLIRQHQTVNLCRSALIRKRAGYSVLCLRSTIAGRGLFIDGNCLAGTLVAFQPGDVWPKEHLMTNAPEIMQHFENDDHSFISLRFDDYVVDSRQAPVTVLSQKGSCNPFALAHMANHSFPELPNCLSTSLDFVKLENDQWLQYIPNTYARAPTWQSKFFDAGEIVMHGLALLSKRDVRNEELKYDYRLQSTETPEWYSPVQYGDEDGGEQVVFFRDDWRK